MIEPKDDLDLELSRLQGATEALHATRGFTDRVLAAIDALRVPEWGDGILKFGKAILVVAALSAVAATVVGIRSQRAETETLASTYGMEDFDW
ncbi:MAG TPA: hypothetical protein VH142_13500 [Polyangiaceae bacterium]|jgi:hypothetical protein|nr:hypothetical protein [Polyangiaceae bacterium]